MNRTLAVHSLLLPALLLCGATTVVAQQAGANDASGTSLTIYNDNLAIARATVDLDLKPGTNEVTTSKVTSQLEPDSVVLRDPTGRHPVQILEQNYDAAVATQAWMLSKYEGQTIQFQVTHGDQVSTVSGRILRAPSNNEKEPLIEVNGQMQFKLPGLPLFPASTDGLLLKPTLRWKIASDGGEHFPAELSYLTHGFNWNATYNIVSATGGSSSSGEEPMDLVGWVTISNNSGTDFADAKVKLMAGDVAQVQNMARGFAAGAAGGVMMKAMAAPQVTQQSFDDFHLYDLGRTVTLKDRETKQIEFLRANAIPVKRTYVYDGSDSTFEPIGSGVYDDRNMGVSNGKTVRIEQEFVNSKANHLGMPLPAGTLRFYRRDADGQMEFVGENSIRHTPEDATVRLTTGNAFDVTGERKQTNFRISSEAKTIDESFTITVKNAKEAPVQVNVTEHLFRAANWDIVEKSTAFEKQDSATVVFPVTVPAHGQQTVTYTVHYSWD
ncbi:DUF4139 domain-containing protein [Silvibacterium dinghuense]|uniref:DUF4139 domain-containing protein n=1 Tax=Silvibacterium dinghuense TaxID=1560006 RepID=UPI0019C53399|nr:DUF4139 domain-containing protein [Silvibacterium dinghuense]GGH16863.1 DUF4139 domain-containing protein [Silvibacterium dinghuense]